MESACFIRNCKDQVMYFCSCREKKTFCCQQHLNNHLNVWNQDDNIDHKVSSLFSNVPQGFLENCKKSLESLQVVEASINLFSQKAKTHIDSYANSILNDIRKLKEVYGSFIQKLNDNHPIKKDVLLSFLPSFNSIYIYSALDKEKRLFIEISTAFSDLYFKQSDEKGLYWDSLLSILKSVSLESAISSSVELEKLNNNSRTLELLNSFVSCQVGQNTYFIKEKERPTSPFLLSIENNTIKELPGKGDAVNYGACVLHNNIIHLFTNSSVVFDCFDFSTYSWISLPNLPSASEEIKASNLGDSIIYSGFSISEVYLYKSSKFQITLKLSINTQKIICPGWIVTDNFLYQNTQDLPISVNNSGLGFSQDSLCRALNTQNSRFSHTTNPFMNTQIVSNQAPPTWVYYPISLNCLKNPSSTVILYKHFICFVSSSSSLIRIDILNKSVESFPIT